MAKKLLKGVGSVAKLAVGGVLGNAILGGGKKKKKTAAAPEPTERVMPLPDDEAIKKSRRDSFMRQRYRGGRLSTILTGGSGSTLGGG